MGMQATDEQGFSSEINVTPFVDVMLVLLVIFMITAPMMNTGVDIDLPETNATVVDESEGQLVLSIDKNSELYLGATKVLWEELPDKLEANEKLQKDKELFIEADQSLPYATVVTAMAVAQEAGARKLQMMTEVSPQLDLKGMDETSGTTNKQ